MTSIAPLIDYSRNRRAFPNVNPFRSFVFDELSARKKSIPTPLWTPVVRLTSCKVTKSDVKKQYKFFTLGLMGYDAKENIFDSVYLGDKEVVGYAYDAAGNKIIIYTEDISPRDFNEAFGNTSDEVRKKQAELLNEAAQQQLEKLTNVKRGDTTRPVPAVSSVKIARHALAAPTQVTIKWTCFNRPQLEYLRHHFMAVGGYCVLEIGHTRTDFQIKKDHIIPFFEPTRAIEEITNCFLKGRNYIIDNYVGPNNGNYDVFVGTVANYSIEYRAETNSFECTTVLVSAGEYLQGLSTNLTALSLNPDDTYKTQTIAEYFMLNGEFDKYIAKLIRSDNQDKTQQSVSGVTNITSNYLKQYKTTKDYEAANINPFDYQFVTWKTFTTKIIPHIFDTLPIGDYKEEIKHFMKLESNGKEEFVGYHPRLLSTDPEVMVIVQKSYLEKGTNAPQDFFRADDEGRRFFGDLPPDTQHPDDRALLSSGVWINIGLIREAFIGTKTFKMALINILNRMNNASAGYWDLQLFWDDQINVFRVIDAKFSDFTKLEVYRFNEPMLDETGECIEIQLDSAFPPEVITQMSIAATVLADQKLLEETLTKYPLFGNTSHYAFAMNWSAFDDVIGAAVRAKINAKQSNTTDTPTTIIQTPTQRTDGQIRQISRITDNLDASAGTGTSTNSPAPNQSIGTLNVSNDNVDLEQKIIPLSTVNVVAPKISNPVENFNFTNKTAKYNGTALLVPEFNQKLQRLFAQLKQEGIKAEINESFRSQDRQDYLREKGDTTTVHSNHTRGTAVDVLLNGGISDKAAFARMRSLSTYYGLVNISDISPKLGVREDWHLQLPNASSFPLITDPNAPQTVSTAAQEQIKANSPPSQTASAPARSSSNIPTPVTQRTGGGGKGGTGQNSQPETHTKDELAKIESINSKFGRGLAILIELNKGAMIAEITRQGFLNHPNKVNGFVAPFPTSAKIEIKVPGIAGISVGDGFVVDKLPFIYESYGLFQTTEIVESISSQGWTTSLKGTFRFMVFDGNAKAFISPRG